MDIRELEKELSQILHEVIGSEAFIDEKTQRIHKEYRLSAKNLIRYLILRSTDLRKYHGTLSDLGLSSIRSAEGYVFSNLYSVVRNLRLIQGGTFDLKPAVEIIGYTGSVKLIRTHANALFQKKNKEQVTEVMVTLPSEAADDPEIIKDLALNGMDIARINLSHDDTTAWEQMITHIRAVENEIGQRILIYMDLSGPKLRTAQIEFKIGKGKYKDSVPVKAGDRILLTKEGLPGKKGKADRRTKLPVIKVQLNAVIDDAKTGDAILFDDGMIRAIVREKRENELELELLDCYKSKIGSFKGINLPDTRLNLPALTEKDIADLPFVCKHADIIGYSFVRTAADVEHLYAQLKHHKATRAGVVFKIENQEAFENLPSILLKGMERSRIGVMVARGDLAVEIGFERISEVQNQILWLCEAAHIPVIWATQVLENLAKTGIPTRAEISDATLSAQAECVMLNKGPNIVSALKLLKNILARMEGHALKKKSELRALNVAIQSMDRLRETVSPG